MAQLFDSLFRFLFFLDFGADETNPARLLYGPIFTEQPVNTIYDKDSNVGSLTMNCEAIANPDPTFKVRIIFRKYVIHFFYFLDTGNTLWCC